MPATSYPRTANGATELSELPIPVTQTVVTMQAQIPGLNAPGDGNGGLFYWDYASTSTPDGFNVILSDNALYATTGRWIRYEPVIPSPGQVAAPVFSPVDASFSGTVDVSITTATALASIFYTTDGSTPTSSSTPYSGPITITVQTAFKAIAILTGYADSNVTSKTYTPITNVVATPVFSPSPGTFSGTIAITITCATAGASIYYTITTNGSGPPPDPTVLDNLYTGPITPVDSDTWIKAIAVKGGLTDSAIAAGNWIPIGTLNILWGSSNNPLITDAADWDNGISNDPFQSNTIPSPVTNENLGFSAVPPDSGPYRYACMLESASPPAASGGWKQNGFSLNSSDFAGVADGYTSTDANGWPYYQILRVADGQLYRQYRLVNQLFGAFTLSLTQ